MNRIDIASRPDWKEKAEDVGFVFHSADGAPYWDESSAYVFGLSQIEDDIEGPCSELHAMCREAAERIVVSEDLMTRLAIPRAHWDLIERSFNADEAELYGRFDLVYDGTGPAKMIEYNADTPTSLYESSAFQWQWLEDQIEAGHLAADTDQFNGVHEALVARFAEILPQNEDVHFTSFAESAEDYATVEYVAYAARDAGLGAHYVPIHKIGLTEAGQFADAENRVIGTLFKLYPWEDMLRDDFAEHIAGAHCRFIEPPWKSVLSNKGLLPVLWRMFEGHPNLLPAFFADEISDGGPAAMRAGEVLRAGHVVKPVYSREGASVTILEDGDVSAAATDRRYDAHPMIVQGYQPLARFGGNYAVLGAWIIGRDCVGLGIREDASRITQDTSLFKPHIIRA